LWRAGLQLGGAGGVVQPPHMAEFKGQQAASKMNTLSEKKYDFLCSSIFKLLEK
jgi:hypothetical protein